MVMLNHHPTVQRVKSPFVREIQENHNVLGSASLFATVSKKNKPLGVNCPRLCYFMPVQDLDKP